MLPRRINPIIYSSLQHNSISTSSLRCIGSVQTKQQVDAGIEEIKYADALPTDQIPTITGTQFLLRKLRGAFRDRPLKLHITFEKAFRRFESDIFCLSVPGMPKSYIIKTPEDIKTLVTKDGKYPIEPGFDFFVEYRQRLRRDMYPDSPGLFGSHGEKWHQVRRLVQQDMLRPKSALYYINDVTEVSNDCLSWMESTSESNEIADVGSYMYRWALEAVCTIFLNARIGALSANPPPEAQEMVDNVNVVFSHITHLTTGIPVWRFIRTKHLDEFDKASEKLHLISEGFINDAKAKMKSEGEARTGEESSVLSKMIARCGEESDVPTVMAMDAILAGMDTTGNSATFFLYVLATNPHKQELIFNEIQEILGDKQLTPTLLNSMKYLKAAMQESMRLFPVVSGVARSTQKDLVFSGYKVPKGSRVVVNSVYSLRSEENFKDPDLFLPERWLRGSPIQNDAHPFLFIPFGHGPRMCIGRRFAEMEIQVLAIQLIRRYRLVYTGKKIDLVTSIVNRPDGPIPIKLEKR